VILGVFRKNYIKENTPMALPESALSELLDALRVGDGVDLVREVAQWALQALIETEAAGVIGAGRYERCDERSNERNGHRLRTLSTKAGDLTLGIPKLRKGSFFPTILEPRRTDRSMLQHAEGRQVDHERGVQEAHGSTRPVELGKFSFRESRQHPGARGRGPWRRDRPSLANGIQFDWDGQTSPLRTLRSTWTYWLIDQPKR
jgi:hypothetical protein